jgi:transposase
LTGEEDFMSRGYSSDLRVRVIQAVECGTAAREAARQFTISASAAIKWVQRWRREGSMSEKPGCGHSRSPLKAHAAWLLELVGKEPDLTLEEIRSKLLEKHGREAGISSLWRFFDRHGISFKKKRAGGRARSPRCG